MSDTGSTQGGGVLGDVVRTPTWPVVGSALCIAISGVLAVVEWRGARDNAELALTGYLFGTLVAAIFVVVHRGQVQAAQRNQLYVARPTLDSWAARLLALGLLLGLWHAYLLATELAKRTAT